MTFSLNTFTAAKLASANMRSERHGEEQVPAVDLKLSLDAPNDILSLFHGDLLTALYHRSGAPADNPQGRLDGVAPVSDVPNLRFPLLGAPLKWEAEHAGCEVVIDYGLGGSSNIVLAGCKVNAFAIEAKQGGTVTLTMRVQCDKELTEKVLGKLATLVQHDVWMKITQPDPDAQPSSDKPLNTAGDGEQRALAKPKIWPFPIDGTKPEPDATQQWLESSGA